MLPVYTADSFSRSYANLTGRFNDKKNHSSEGDNLDNKYEDSQKKHRNWMSSFDHLYELISHPFSLFLFFVLILIIFIVFRYLDIYFDNQKKIYTHIHQDAKTALSYMATIIVTSVFTKFFEKRKGNLDR